MQTKDGKCMKVSLVGYEAEIKKKIALGERAGERTGAATWEV